MMSNPYIGERRVVTGVPRAIGACEEGLRRDPTARCAERAATTTRDHKQTRGMTKLIRFCRKVDDNILLSTSSSIFDVLSFQYVVWFVNFATEPKSLRQAITCARVTARKSSGCAIPIKRRNSRRSFS